jgi:tetratricopeptide (TPR) repeat protein
MSYKNVRQYALRMLGWRMDRLQQQLRDLRVKRDWKSGIQLLSQESIDLLEPETQHEAARFYYNARDYDKSKDILLKLADIQPEKRSVFSDLGLVFERKGIFDKACQFYDKAVSLGGSAFAEKAASCKIEENPNSFDIIENLAGQLPQWKYHFFKGRAFFNAKDLTSAFGETELSLLHKQDNENLVLMAKIQFASRNYSKSLDVLEKLEKSFPKDFRIYELKGNIYQERGEAEQALDSFNKAYKLNSRLSAVLGSIARLNYNLGNLETAREWIDKALQKRDNLPEWWACSGRIHVHDGNFSEAEKAFLKEDQLAKSSISALNVAYAKIKNGDLAGYRDYKILSEQRSFTYETVKAETKSKTLFVTLAPAGGAILKKFGFPGDLLALCDMSGTYYALCAEPITDLIADFVMVEGYNRVAFIGSSKGGMGALLISTLVGRKLPHIDVKCLSFSPQTQIWPYNDNLKMPSYRALMERCKGNELLRNTVAAYGDMNEVTRHAPENAKLKVIYGKGFVMDAIEAEKIINTHVHMQAVDFSGHGTLMVYTIPENMDRAKIEAKFSTIKGDDADSASLNDVDSPSLVQEMIALYETGHHTLKGIISSWDELA